MGKKRKQLPAWSYNRNVNSNFGQLTEDLFVSVEYQELSTAEKQFLNVLIVHRATPCNSKALSRCLMERYETENGNNRDSPDEHQARVSQYVREMLQEERLFVFPAKHAERYGYTKQNSCKLMQSLVKAGFVEVVENNRHRRKMNLYSFSTNWKSRKFKANYGQQEVYKTG